MRKCTTHCKNEKQSDRKRKTCEEIYFTMFFVNAACGKLYASPHYGFTMATGLQHDWCKLNIDWALFPNMLLNGKRVRCRFVRPTVLVHWLCRLDWYMSGSKHTLTWSAVRSWVSHLIYTTACRERGPNMKLKHVRPTETTAVLTTPLWDLVLTSSFRVP